MSFWESLDSTRPVLVIGTSGLDLIAAPQEPLQVGDRVPARIRTAFGGVARNVAENLARLEHEVRFITAVGQDPEGHYLLEHLANLGVDVSLSRVVDEHPTGTYIGLLRPEGGLHYGVHDMRVIDALTPDYLKAHEDAFAQADVLFIDANLSPATLRTIFRLARRHRLPVAADATSTTLAPRLLPYLDQIGLLTQNHLEASALLGQTIPQDDFAAALRAAQALVARGVDLALVTLAEFGVCYATPYLSGHIPAVRTEVRDPTGAGDALTATVLFALREGLPPDEAVRLGTAAAALTLREPGTVVPDLSLERLYAALGAP
ncbi:MAG: ribokinase [Chloroflexi bacterium]|nr:ribokinase [Chloroflexota bacterium]